MSLLKKQRELYRLGERIKRGEGLTPLQAKRVGDALIEIALGASAADAFSLDKDGRSAKLLRNEIQRKFAIGWIAAAVDRSELGLGLTVKEATRQAAHSFGFTESTLRKLWNGRNTNRSPDFSIP
jgi:hypothetical protein